MKHRRIYEFEGSRYTLVQIYQILLERSVSKECALEIIVAAGQLEIGDTYYPWPHESGITRHPQNFMYYKQLDVAISMN